MLCHGSAEDDASTQILSRGIAMQIHPWLSRLPCYVFDKYKTKLENQMSE